MQVSVSARADEKDGTFILKGVEARGDFPGSDAARETAERWFRMQQRPRYVVDAFRVECGISLADCGGDFVAGFVAGTEVHGRHRCSARRAGFGACTKIGTGFGKRFGVGAMRGFGRPLSLG